MGEAERYAPPCTDDSENSETRVRNDDAVAPRRPGAAPHPPPMEPLMSVTQSLYSEIMPPSNPDAVQATVQFVEDPRVVEIEPIVASGKSWPDHTIALALPSPEVRIGPVLVLHQAEGLDNRTLLAFRPEDAHRLAHQLLSHKAAQD